MELLWVLAFLAGLVLLAMMAAAVAWWSRLYQMKFEARLQQDMLARKQDMLARGLSVEEIERLMNISPSPAPSLPPAKGQASNVAYSLAGAIEDMVGMGKETEEIAALLEIFLERGGEPPETGKGPDQPPEPATAAARRADVQRLSRGLAPALESMVQNGKNTGEIAEFLDTFLQRSGVQPEVSKVPDLALQLTGAAVRSSDIQRLGSGRDG
jgi:hypothetical protein